MRPRETPASGRGPRRETTVVTATIDEQHFASADGTWAVVGATIEPSGEAATMIGEVASMARGESARFTGFWEDHSKFGRRFRVLSYAPILPSSDRGLVRFLGSGLVKGVGESLATKLVARFGEQTLDVITKQSARLREVSGVGAKKAEALRAAVLARREEAESFAFLHGVGLGPALARRVFKEYGPAAPARLKDDPYLAAEQVAGIGFLTADRIGREVGIGQDDPRRARGAILHVLARAADDGHTHLDERELATAMAKLSVPAALVPDALEALVERGLVVRDGTSLYPPPLHEAEVELASLLADRAKIGDAPEGAARALELAMRGVQLEELQREAVTLSLRARVMVLTGGPGTGKTTTVRALVAAHEALGHRVLLAAPTGRAAKRLSEAAGREARTVHRLLEWNPSRGGFARSAEEPLECDVVVADEASMLHLQLALALVSALPPDATLVLVGDADQLPPVGPGHVLREVLASGVIPVVQLARVFRQAEASAIVRGAHEILRGRAPTATPPGTKGSGDLFFVRATDPAEASRKLVEVLTRLPKAYELDPRRDVQVLTPTRRGPLGTDALNELLAAHFNPTRGSARFSRGDKVMQLQNDYEREVWNGDVGWVTDVRDGVTYVDFDGRAVSYLDDELGALSLAYAATVHKAQGSELPAIALVMTNSHYVMLSRALLYTAVTRGKRVVVIVGDPGAVQRAARTAETTRTQSRLAERMRSERADTDA
ncbi:MAG: ATP-dependent RecD-like DNA helicase [Sandaracinus sp.]